MGIESAFRQFPQLETERLFLREIHLEDACDLFGYFSLEEVVEYYDLAAFTTEQQAVDLIRLIAGRYQEGKQIRWGIALKATNQLIGSCGFHAIERDHFKAEIGYELHKDFWGRGIMTEAIREVLQYGFNVMELNRIEAFYFPENIASAKVLEKNRFTYEGILKQRFFEKGKFVDAAISGLVREDFEKCILA